MRRSADLIYMIIRHKIQFLLSNITLSLWTDWLWVTEMSNLKECIPSNLLKLNALPKSKNSGFEGFNASLMLNIQDNILQTDKFSSDTKEVFVIKSVFVIKGNGLAWTTIRQPFEC